MRSFSKAVILCGAAPVALTLAGVFAGAAFAQAADTTEAASADVQGEGEILVTARRREETLMDVPIAIASVDSKFLDNKAISDLRGLDGFVPNVNVQAGTTSASASQIFLRGVGTDDVGFGTDPNVGVYLDDIFIGRFVGSMAGALDLERIEVLRGPQGTLYGRNSTAGAVKFVTRKPDVNESRAKLAVTLGSEKRRDFKGSANVMLAEGKAALLLSAQTRNQGGYIKLYDDLGRDTGERANGMDAQDYRAALRLLPNEDLTIDLSVDYTHNRSGIQALTPTNCALLGTNGLVPGIVTDAAGEYVPGNVSAGQLSRCPLYYGDPYASYRGPFPWNDPKFDSAGAASVISLDLGSTTLKWVSSYRGFRDVFSSSLNGKPLFNDTVTPNVGNTQINLRSHLRQRQLQQELQASSSMGGFFDYTVGLFYLREKVRSNYQTQVYVPATPTDAGPAPRLNRDVQISTGTAIYGELYIRPIDRLEITLGGRYSWDRKSIDRERYTSILAATPAGVADLKIKSHKFTPKLGISYDTGPLLLFASYTEGYRTPGVINSNPSSDAAMVLESVMETEKSYEGGFKARLLNGMFSIAGTAFSAKYSNLQATLTINGVTTVVTSDAKIKGLEFEATARPVDGLSLFANAGFMKNHYTKPPAGQPYAVKLKHAPKYNFVIGGQYETAFGDTPGKFFIGGDLSSTGKAYRNVANTIDNQSDGYSLLSARFGYRAEDDKWSITFGGTNLTDKVYYMLGTQNAARSYQPGRRFYGTVEVNF